MGLAFETRLDQQIAKALQLSSELSQPVRFDKSPSVHKIRQAYAEERLYWNDEHVPLGRVENLNIPGPHGEIPCRIYASETAITLPVLVYLHGGGFVVGSIDTHDRIMRLLASKAGIAVLGVDYRLSPEHRFPAALEEILFVIDHIKQEGNVYGLDPKSICLGGDSSGANLSASACLSIKNNNPRLIKAVILAYGWFGLRDSGSRIKFCREEEGLSEDEMNFYISSYLAHSKDEENPLVDILRADLSGFPPAKLIAAELDPLLDDSLKMQALLTEARTDSSCTVFPGAVHGFLHYSKIADLSLQALDECASFIRKHALNNF